MRTPARKSRLRKSPMVKVSWDVVKFVAEVAYYFGIAYHGALALACAILPMTMPTILLSWGMGFWVPFRLWVLCSALTLSLRWREEAKLPYRNNWLALALLKSRIAMGVGMLTLLFWVLGIN